MLKALNLQNFKTFKNSGYVDFKKINIFIGPNSSGKSSFLKALLMLYNTMSSDEIQPAIHLNDEIGGFSDIVFGQTKNNKITFSMKLDNSDTLQENELKSIVFEQEAFLFLTIQDSKENPMRLSDVFKSFYEKYKEYLTNRMSCIEVTIKDTPKKPNVVDNLKINFLNNDICEIQLIKNSYYIRYNDNKFGNVPNLVKPFKFLFRMNEERVANIDLEQSTMLLNIAIALKMAELSLKSFTKNIIHIEPFRNKPKRAEFITNFKFNTVGAMGENTISAVLGLKNLDGEKSKTIMGNKALINQWLSNFDLAQAVDVEELKNNQYSMIIKNKFTGISSNIMDVGVGTSQLLPIIIESINSPRGSILLIEEPETHIHPNAQAKLGELFVECSKHKKRFFVETHSMYLVKQLQISVARGDIIDPSDIGVYYFEQSKDGTHIKDLKLQKNGQFAEEIPKGFFDVPFQLSQELRKYM